MFIVYAKTVYFFSTHDFYPHDIKMQSCFSALFFHFCKQSLSAYLKLLIFFSPIFAPSSDSSLVFHDLFCLQIKQIGRQYAPCLPSLSIGNHLSLNIPSLQQLPVHNTDYLRAPLCHNLFTCETRIVTIFRKVVKTTCLNT